MAWVLVVLFDDEESADKAQQFVAEQCDSRESSLHQMDYDEAAAQFGLGGE